MPGVCAGFFYLCAVWQVRIPTASVINTCDTSIAHRYASIPWRGMRNTIIRILIAQVSRLTKSTCFALPRPCSMLQSIPLMCISGHRKHSLLRKYPQSFDEKYNHQDSYRTGEQIDKKHLLCFAQTVQYAAEHSAYVHQWTQKTQSSKEISTKLR